MRASWSPGDGATAGVSGTFCRAAATVWGFAGGIAESFDSEAAGAVAGLALSGEAASGRLGILFGMTSWASHSRIWLRSCWDRPANSRPTTFFESLAQTTRAAVSIQACGPDS